MTRREYHWHSAQPSISVWF